MKGAQLSMAREPTEPDGKEDSEIDSEIFCLLPLNPSNIEQEQLAQR